MFKIKFFKVLGLMRMVWVVLGWFIFFLIYNFFLLFVDSYLFFIFGKVFEFKKCFLGFLKFFYVVKFVLKGILYIVLGIDFNE